MSEFCTHRRLSSSYRSVVKRHTAICIPYPAASAHTPSQPRHLLLQHALTVRASHRVRQWGVHETRARESQNGKGGAKGGTRKGKEEARETRRVLFPSQLGSWKFSQSRRHVDRRKHETGPFVTKVGVVITGREERNEGTGEKEGKGRQMISNTSPKTKHIVKAPTIVCVCPFLVKRKIVEHCKNTEVRFHKLNIYNSQEDTSIISFKNLKIPSSTTNKAFNSVDY